MKLIKNAKEKCFHLVCVVSALYAWEKELEPKSSSGPPGDFIKKGFIFIKWIQILIDLTASKKGGSTKSREGETMGI